MTMMINPSISANFWIDTGGQFGKHTHNATGSFIQRYGYFVYDAKLPNPSSTGSYRTPGNEFDLEMFGASSTKAEMSWANLSGDQYNYTGLYAPYEIGSTSGGHWNAGTNFGIDLTQDFHQYGVYWANDGSAHGSVTAYMDGNSLNNPYALTSAGWDNGGFFHIWWSGGGDGTPILSGLQIRWVRAFQLEPN